MYLPTPPTIRRRRIGALVLASILSLAASSSVKAVSTWRPLSDTRANNGVWMASATVGWTVGDVGMISQTTDGGTTWAAQTSGVSVNLNAVWGTDATHVWAVGNGGTILQWNGTAWAAQTSNTTQDLNAIHGASASAIWAVGKTATLVKFDGTNWAVQAPPSGGGPKPTLQGVWAADATNVWAVGTGGRIFKGNGTTWASQTSGTSEDLFAVGGTSATNILAVGAAGTVRFTSNGTAWAAGPSSGVSTILRGISGTDASNVWIVGDSGVVRFYNGTGTFAAQTSNTTRALNAVFAFSTTNVTAVGGGKTFDHFDGTTWTAQASPVPSGNFTGVWASDDDNVWFSGPSGVMMRWNGSAFTLTPSTGVAVTLNDVWGSDPSNMWAVGAGGTIIKWNGTAWNPQTSGTGQNLNSVSGSSATDVWAVGAGGTILHFNGTAWSATTSGTGQGLNGVWATSTTAAWAVGNGGVILKWNGTAWAAQTSGTTQTLNEIQGASPTAIWAVGAGGTILKYSGSAWAAQTSGIGTALIALTVVNSTTLWAMGGTDILKGNGTAWAPDGSTGFPNGALGAWATGPNTVFLSTQTGLIFTNAPVSTPEISVEQPAGTKLLNNSAVSFGNVLLPGSNSSTLTFTIASSGNVDLTGLAITKDGTNAAEFTFTALSTTSLTTGTTTTFDVTFTPTADGTRTATLHIASNDLDEAPFNLLLTGAGVIPITITTQPVSKAVNPNTAVTFTVAATGSSPITYQWQKLNAVTTLFEDITGETSTSYAIASVVEANQGDYRVIVTNAAGSVPSNTVTLSVNDPVAIVAPLIASQTVALNSTVTFTVTATGSEPKKYQWRKNGTNLVNSAVITGATSATLTITGAQLTHAGDYSVVISNMVLPAKTSTVASLTVVDATLKTLVLPTGGKAVITASYAGKVTGFVWKKGSAALPLDFRYTFLKNVLTISVLQIADAADYTCDITGTDGSTIITTTKLVVYSSPPEITGTPPLTMPNAMVGDPAYSYQIPFDPDPLKTPASFIASGLPTGLKCNALTGLITGKPAVALTADKTYAVTLTASNLKNKSVKTANLLLKALPAASVGVFTGPIVRQNPLNKNLGGRFDLTTISTGSFTGKVTLGALAYSFSGALVADVTGTAVPTGVVLIKRTLPLLNLNLTFTMDLANHALTSCDVNDGANHASFSAWRKRWGTVMPQADLDDLKTYLGYYTFGLAPAVPVTVPPVTAAEVQPQGLGYGSFTVASTGLITAAGKLPDSTAWTCATFCGPHGEVLVYQVLYSSLGSIVGSLDVTQGTVGNVPPYGDSTLAGTVSWKRPATATHVYKTGFGPIDLTAGGGRYVNPAPALLFGVNDDGGISTNSRLVFTDGGISGTSTDATGTQVSPNVNVRVKAGGLVYVPPHSALIIPDPNPRSTTLVITQGTGYFTGKSTLVDPNPAKVGTNITRTPSYYGMIVREGGVMRGYGFFLLARRPDPATTQTVLTTDQLSGQVVLEKSP